MIAARASRDSRSDARAAPESFTALSAQRVRSSRHALGNQHGGFSRPHVRVFFYEWLQFSLWLLPQPDLLAGGDKCYIRGTSWERSSSAFANSGCGPRPSPAAKPTIHAALPDTIAFLKKHGFAVKLDSNGSRPDMLERLLPELDYVAMDLKCSLDSYPALTGWKDVEAIRRSLRLIQSSARDYEFRTTLLETLHTNEELHDCGKLIQGAKLLVLQPFVPHENLPAMALRTQPRQASRLQKPPTSSAATSKRSLSAGVNADRAAGPNRLFFARDGSAGSLSFIAASGRIYCLLSRTGSDDRTIGHALDQSDQSDHDRRLDQPQSDRRLDRSSSFPEDHGAAAGAEGKFAVDGVVFELGGDFHAAASA